MSNAKILVAAVACALALSAGLAWLARSGRWAFAGPLSGPLSGASEAGERAAPSLSEARDSAGRTPDASREAVRPPGANDASDRAAEPSVELTPAAQALLERASADQARFEAIGQMADQPDERGPEDRQFLEDVQRIHIEDQLELSELGQQLHAAERTALMLQQLKSSTSK